METNYLKNTMIFDRNVLIPGNAVKLIVPGEVSMEERMYNALIKHVTPFSITLIVGVIDGVKENEYPIEMFEGSTPLQLVPMYTENEWKEAKHWI